jgi:8-oxo-dGTP pyrophosphatase MutT (NUDIX family)
MSDHGKFKINIDAVITNPEGGLLILRQEGKWKLPGGRMEEGETPTACLAREVREETGITGLVIGQPINVGLSESGSTCLITFQGQVESNPSVDLSNEHDQYAWADSSSLDQYEFAHNALKEIIRKAMQWK